MSVSPNPVSSASSDIQRKTTSSIPDSPPTVDRSGLKNVLNDYRSFTYIFTLSALKKTGASDPNSFLASEQNFTILKSSGKSGRGITAFGASSDLIEKTNAPVYDKFDAMAKQSNQKTLDNINKNAALVTDFNAAESSKFDMFIDDVSIETLMAFEPRSNITLPTKIEFTVMEPYGINGFIEAIHIAAVAAGYDTYVEASFLLKVEFIGYADTNDIHSPAKIIPNSSRYFPFIFTGLEVTLTEKGTQYRCSAVPFNEKGFGEPNVIKKPISVGGNSVFEILNNLMKGVNGQIADFNKASKSAEASAAGNDEYIILFKSRDAATNNLMASEKGKIPEATLNGFFKDKTLFKMPDPGSRDKPDGYKDNKEKQPTTQQQASQPQIIKYEPVNQKPGVQFADGAAIHECISVIIRDSDYIRNILKAVTDSTSEVIDKNTGLLDYFIVTMQVEFTDKMDLETRKPFKKFTYVVSPYKVHYTQIPGYKAAVIDERKLKSVSLRSYNYIYTGQNVDVLNFKLNFNTLFFEAVPAAMGNNKSPSARDTASKEPSNQPNLSPTDPKAAQANINGTPPTRTDAKPSSIAGQAGGRAGQPSDSPYSVLAINMHEAIINSKASMLTGTLDILGDPFYLITGGVGNVEPAGHPTIPGMTKDGAAANNYGIVLIDINFRTPVDITSSGSLSFKTVPFSGVYMVTQAKSNFKDGVFKQELSILRMPGQIISASLPETNPATVQTSRPDPAENPIPLTDAAELPSIRADTVALDELSRGVLDPASNFTASPGGLGLGALSNTSGLNSAVINNIMNVSIGGVNPLTTGIRLSGLTAVSNTLGSAAAIGQSVNTLASALPINASSAVTQLTNAVNKLSTVSAISQSAQATVAGLGASAASLVSGVSTKINALTGSNPFGIDSSKISGVVGLSGMKSKIFDQLDSLKSKLPSGIEAALSQGIIFNLKNIGNLPAFPPDSVAPDIEVDSYTQALSTAPTSLLPTANKFLSDATALSGKILSASAQISNITKSIPTPESLLNSVNAAVSPVNFGLAKSATDIFGSKSASPLASLLSTSNKTNTG